MLHSFNNCSAVYFKLDFEKHDLMVNIMINYYNHLLRQILEVKIKHIFMSQEYILHHYFQNYQPSNIFYNILFI